MAYGVKYRLQHKTSTNTNEATHVVELLKDGYTGSVTDIKGNKSKGVGKLFFEKLDPKEPFKNPAIKGRFELYLQVRSQGVDSILGYDGQAILDEIFASDENEFQMQYKLDGTVVWTGAVMPGMLDYPDGQYAYSGTIIAKDLTRLSGISYGLNTGRETLITTIADLLGRLGYSLPIYTYTSWTESNILNTDDFLNQIYNDTFALRQYAQSGDETDQPIKCDEALDYILRNHGLFLRQDEGVWRLYQLSALTNPASVKEYQYNSAGVQQTSTTVDLTTTIDRVNRFKKPGGLNSVNDGIKQTKLLFDHRTTVSNIKFPDKVTLQPADNADEYTQYFQSDGNQSIDLSFKIEGTFTSPSTPVVGRFKIKAGSYSWDIANQTWQSFQTINEIHLTQGLNTPGGDTYFFANINVNTANLPVDADDDITITLYHAEDNVGTKGNFTYFTEFAYAINNPAVEEGNNTAIEYELTQTGDQSKNYDHGTIWFGDGPTAYSRAALSADSAGSTLTSDTWKIIGEASTVYHANLLMREFIDSQRTARLSLGADLIGDYSSKNLIVHDSKNLFFLGGELTLGEHEWNGLFWQINIVTGTDDFDIIYKNSESGTSSAGGSTGGSGGNTAWGDLVGKPDTTAEWGTEIGVDFASYLKASDDATISGDWDFNQQYTDIGQGFAGSNFGIRGPRSGASDAYNYFDVNANRWGSKFGAAGGFSRFLQDGDNPTLSGATFTGAISGTNGEFTGNLVAYRNGNAPAFSGGVYSVSELTATTGINLPNPDATGNISLLAANGKIDNVFLSGVTADEVDWTNILNNPFNSSTPSSFATASHTHSHFTATNNPHSVTKAQVGLGNLPNSTALSNYNNDAGFLTSIPSSYVQTGDSPSFANFVQAKNTSSNYGYFEAVRSDGVRGGYFGFGNASQLQIGLSNASYLNVIGPDNSSLRVNGSIVWNTSNLPSPVQTGGNASFNEVTLTTGSIRSSNPIALLFSGDAQSLQAKTVLTSDTYSDQSLVPVLGAYFKGQTIHQSGALFGSSGYTYSTLQIRGDIDNGTSFVRAYNNNKLQLTTYNNGTASYNQGVTIDQGGVANAQSVNVLGEFKQTAPNGWFAHADARNINSVTWLHKYVFNGSVFSPYYENWYDGINYYSIGVDSGEFQFGTGANISGDAVVSGVTYANGGLVLPSTLS